MTSTPFWNLMSGRPWATGFRLQNRRSEVKFLTWTDDNLLRQVVYQGLREDKPASEVRRHVPHPKLAADG